MMTGTKGKSGRKPKNGIRTGVHLDPAVYAALKFRGELSTEIEKLTRASMKSSDTTLPDNFRTQYYMVENFDRYALDDLETAIYARRLQLAAQGLERAGYTCRVEAHDIAFRYVLVYPPDGSIPAVWASLTECQRLLDTVANLPLQEAFTRWSKKVEPIPSRTYTRADAIRDIQIERAALKTDYDAEHISAEDMRLGYDASRDYLDLAE